MADGLNGLAMQMESAFGLLLNLGLRNPFPMLGEMIFG
jgi:hypothetical protein